MINLIPPHGRTALTHEYILRVGSLYGFVIGGVLMASAALMVPTYVLTGSQLKALRMESPETEEIKSAFDRASEEIKIANALASQLRVREKSSEYMYSQIIEEIVRSASGGIVFANFQGGDEEKGLREIMIQGTAANRSTLAEFKASLEAAPLFEKADIPISDLARDTNLPFVVTVTLADTIATP
jgi:hypothetical protein